MPAERQPALRLDRDDLPGVGLAGVRLLGAGDILVNRRRRDHTSNGRPCNERAVEADPEPLAELVGVADRLPHPIQRRVQDNFFFDSI